MSLFLCLCVCVCVSLYVCLTAIGHEVKVVNGPYRGETALLEAVQTDKYIYSPLSVSVSPSVCVFVCDRFSVVVRLLGGPSKGKTVEGIPYEDVCKLQA